MTRVRVDSRSIEKAVAEENRVGAPEIVIDASRELIGIVCTDGVQNRVRSARRGWRKVRRIAVTLQKCQHTLVDHARGDNMPVAKQITMVVSGRTSGAERVVEKRGSAGAGDNRRVCEIAG